MGKVIVVGIGPGSYEDMTIRADAALRACDAIVGYPVYVDLVRDRYPGKRTLRQGGGQRKLAAKGDIVL